MVATVDISESNLATESVTDNITNCNYGNDDSPNLVTATYPITAGNNSFEKYWRINWSGSFNQIDNLQVWVNPDVDSELDLISNLTTSGYVNKVYATPVTGSCSSCSYQVPTADPTQANLGIGGSLAGTTNATGYSDYVISQLTSAGTAAPGDMTQVTYTFQYDEQ